ncbi:MAG: single-stranded-DNA-specific exonuclease RecJ [Patescibacteria group bacterium]|nr:single-stranded-DNA-specific exonuclease RecJ [Patescibacteria group bacterium]
MPNKTEFLELLLKNRNIEDTEKFLNPSYDDDLYDPFLLKDLEKACIRIFEAIEANEKVVIYGDYDCDGIPAVVIINDLFNKVGFKNYSVYIPDRHKEGYGLHSDAIEKFTSEEVKLLITFDLGITANSEVAKAQANGIDVIITDHHLPQQELPPAFAIVNPKICDYPDQMLCGAAVAFKLIQGLIFKYGKYWKIPKGWEKWMLDMVGFATLADQVPLLNENRVFALYGLKVLRKTKRPGLVEIFRKARVSLTELTEDDVIFTLAPKINAASRMDSPMTAFELLSTKDSKRAKDLTDFLFKINNERKYLVAQIMKDVKKNIGDRVNKPVIVIGNPKWRVGVLGIVAAKLVDKYQKPAFVWGQGIKGSCRGLEKINLVEWMASLPENSLVEFGGHFNAGGFKSSYEEIHFLEERLIKVMEGQDEVEKEDGFIDADISLDDVIDSNYQIIERLAPYGLGNIKPTFSFKNIEVVKIKEFGKEKNHLEISFRNNLKAISFFKKREDYGIEEGNKINLIANFEKNNFNGISELRLRILDIIKI